jgi:nickel-dependent lactate racemase
MHVELLYGRGHLPLELPDDWRVSVIRKPPMPVLSDPPVAVRAALAEPVAARPLMEEARGKRSACILICDITRPVPNGLLLPEMVRELLAAGLAAEDIRVLVATGLHRPNEGRELEELIGDRWVLDTVRVENHFARNDGDHVLLGSTAAGTVVRLDKRFVHADLRIVTGLVEPHFMAGFSGGRKVIAPGVAHAETITTFHNARFMSDPQADNCVLEGNPLHREQMEIVQMLGHVLAVNTVLDEHRRLSFVNYGEVIQSHLAAVAYTQRYAQVPVPRRFKTVVTSAAGYPLDKTYYQTVKGMVGPMDILEPGGNLVVVSECSEGIGSAEYVDAQRRLIALGPDGFLQDIGRKSHADIDEWQTQMQLRPQRVGSIHLFSEGLKGSARALTGVHMIDSVVDTLSECVRSAGDSSVAVVPEGPYVVPVYRPTASQ